MKKPDLITILYAVASIGFLVGSAFLLSWNISGKKSIRSATAGSGITLQEPMETPEYYIEEAKSYTSTGRLQDAIRSYQFALSLSPSNPAVLEPLLDLQLETMDISSALGTATTLLRTNPTSEIYHAKLLETKLKFAKSPEEIRRIFQEATNLSKTDSRLTKGLEVFLCLESVFNVEPKEILSRCTPDSPLMQKALDQAKLFQTFKDGNTAYLAAMLAKTLMEYQYFTLAEHLLAPVVINNPTYRDAFTLLGFSYLMQNKLEVAKETLSTAYSLDTTRADIQYMLGLVYEGLGDVENALRYYTIALGNQYPKQDELRGKIASFHIAKQEYDKAILHYTKLLEGPVSSPEYFTTPVWIYIEILKDPLAAISYAKSARAKFPDSPITINLLGWAYLANGDTTQAKPLFELAIEKDARYAPPYYNLGLYYQTAKQHDQASTYFQLAIQKDPTSSVADLAREQLQTLP